MRIFLIALQTRVAKRTPALFMMIARSCPRCWAIRFVRHCSPSRSLTTRKTCSYETRACLGSLSYERGRLGFEIKKDG